jgi:hypothetical protein
MPSKYLALVAGKISEVLAAAASAGAGDAGKIVALDGTGRIDSTMMPVGIGAETVTITTSEALAAGDFVNIHVSSGTKVRKADATAAGKEAHGFVLASSASGASATVYLEGTNTGLTGLTAGATQFLATTAGGRTETAPSTTGQVVQIIGTAISATAMTFEPNDAITLA